jgi:ADP-ribosylation factor-binding protein GGA
MCEEESDDQAAVAKLFEINDSINRTIQRYKLVKKGDLEGASKIPHGTLGTSTGVRRDANNEFSLIDLGGEPESAPDGTPASHQKSASLQDDLLGLSLSDQPYGQTGGISLAYGANTSMQRSNVH